MAFQQNYNGYNNNNGANNGGNGEPKKKSNFGIGRIYGTDGTVDVSIWKSEKGGCYCIINTKAAVGKDPSTGANVYEQKMANELPSVFMPLDIAKAFLMATKNTEPSTLNISIDTGRGSKLSVVGSPADVKVTIENNKGSRSVTLPAVNVGSATVHANFENFISYIEFGYKKCLTNKLDPSEFAMVTNEDENSTEVPF